MQNPVDIRELQERVERESSFVDALTLGMNQVIVGQKHLVESLLIGLLSDGHILLEGVPGHIVGRRAGFGKNPRYQDLKRSHQG